MANIFKIVNILIPLMLSLFITQRNLHSCMFIAPPGSTYLLFTNTSKQWPIGLDKVLLNDNEVTVEQLREEMKKISNGGYIYSIDIGEELSDLVLDFRTAPFGTPHNSINYYDTCISGHIFDDSIQLSPKYIPLMINEDPKEQAAISRARQQHYYELYVKTSIFLIKSGFPNSFILHTGMKTDLKNLITFGIIKNIPHTLEELANLPLPINQRKDTLKTSANAEIQPNVGYHLGTSM